VTVTNRRQRDDRIIGRRQLRNMLRDLSITSPYRVAATYEYSAEKGAALTSDHPPAGTVPGTSARHAPLPFDTSVAHQARVYDYLLGGKDNYAADRAVAEATLKVNPDLAPSAHANRAFLGRAVRYLAGEAGVRQFLDIGTGIPTAGNVHEVAQAIAPEARVVYVDYDPIVLAHARALLTSNEPGLTEYIDSDIRDTQIILDQAAGLLDFSKPAAITLISILHAIPDDDDPYAIVARLLGAVPSGSYLVISHMGSDLMAPKTLREMDEIWKRGSQQQYTPRDRGQVARFFEGTDLVEPGLVRVEEWHPEHGAGTARKSIMWSAAGRKPESWIG
jgi:hypothetical protein